MWTTFDLRILEPAQPCLSGLSSRFQPLLHLLMVHKAGLLLDQAALRENCEVWNATHIEASSQLRILLGINLEHDGPAAHLRSGARNFRGGHSARAAPGSPEIYQYRHAGLLDYFVEQLGIDFQRFRHRLERCFAGAAASRARQMLGGDAVLTATRLARANGRHYDLGIPPPSSRQIFIGLRGGDLGHPSL